MRKAISKKKIEKETKEVLNLLKERKIFLATMESCTGGALINQITNIPGASEVTRGGIVAYSDKQKIFFGIPKNLIKKYTVYSKEVALSMARVAQKKFKSEIGVGITGVLSRKDPKYPSKKVGEVYLAVVFKKKKFVKKLTIPPQKNRANEKLLVVLEALKSIKEILD